MQPFVPPSQPDHAAAITTLATALRSGRAARRQQLSRLDGQLTRALPVWVGFLPDIDDLLPAVAGLFDVVILDGESSAEQPLAAPALLRGPRGVVVGGPQQLRHVSFLSDEQMSAAVEMHHLDDDPLLAARLDVRRNSAFDTAAAVAPVLTLDEHFRSDPHLVDFEEAVLGASRRTISKLSTSGVGTVHAFQGNCGSAAVEHLDRAADAEHSRESLVPLSRARSRDAPRA